MKILVCILTFLIAFNSSASQRYQIISGTYYITDKLNILASYNHFSEVFTPKYFPNDYSIKFETKRAFEEFFESSIKLKTLIQNICYEFVVFKGEIILQKRYLRKEHCVDKNYKKDTKITCDILREHSDYGNSKYRVEYNPSGSFFRNCDIRVEYQNQKIDLLRGEKRNFPQDITNRTIQDKWYITSLGNFISLQKDQFKQKFFLEENSVYFESPEAYLIFNDEVNIRIYKQLVWHKRSTCHVEKTYRGYSKKIKTFDENCVSLDRFTNIEL